MELRDNLFGHKNFLLGEEFENYQNIKDWLQNKVLGREKDSPYINFLLKNGKHFKDVHKEFPVDIIKPDTCWEGMCHANNFKYADTILAKQPSIVDECAFVTGLYGLHATHPLVPNCMRYIISHHTFLCYKGIVIDCTDLYFPQKYYDIDQYFGIPYSLQTASDLLKELSQRTPEEKLLMPLIFLQHKPFLTSA